MWKWIALGAVLWWIAPEAKKRKVRRLVRTAGRRAAEHLHDATASKTEKQAKTRRLHVV
jgi:hypothetical protein